MGQALGIEQAVLGGREDREGIILQGKNLFVMRVITPFTQVVSEQVQMRMYLSSLSPAANPGPPERERSFGVLGWKAAETPWLGLTKITGKGLR